MAGHALSAIPTDDLFRFPAQFFRVLLLRRLWLPLPLSSRTCRCGRLLDVFGHHRAACPRAGVLGSRGFSLETAVCQEAGARVSVNVFLRDLDLPVPCTDARRLEIVADGLLLFGGAQLAVDTTLVSAIRGDGRPQAGVAITEAARKKRVVTYLELIGTGGRTRLVVLAAEVGGRWSQEAFSFVSQLARAKARSEPRILAVRARQAWHHRWCSLLACAA